MVCGLFVNFNAGQTRNSTSTSAVTGQGQTRPTLQVQYKNKKKGINAPWYGNSLDSGMLTDQFRHSVTIPCCDSVFPQYKWVYVYQVGVVVLLYLYLLVRTQEFRERRKSDN